MNNLIKKTVIVAVFLLSGSLFSHDGYWAPSDPPKSGYMIDVSVDMKTNKIEGRETISMKNNTGLPIEIIAIDWRISETCTFNIKTGSRELELINETKNGHAVSP
ncbi:MAG: hypothetical protein KAX11_10075, partial [Candidatus Aminicenantes bacterium]|nr:hypothetical protein [Candidatus Aminicenantes bacterium]